MNNSQIPTASGVNPTTAQTAGQRQEINNKGQQVFFAYKDAETGKEHFVPDFGQRLYYLPVEEPEKKCCC